MEPVVSTTTEIAAILAEVASLRAEVQQLRTAQARHRARLPGRLLRAGLLAGLVALLLGSSASAAIPNATTNLITGCYRTAGTMNLLYVLNTPAQTTCPTGMTVTTWPGTYRRTVVVSPISGGTTTQNGTALLAALNDITTASSTNPYLLKIEPGVYDLNGGTLNMQPYVDIEGSGEDVTTITSGTALATVQGADNAEMRWLTVQNTAAGYAVEANATDSTARFLHVTARGTVGFAESNGLVTLQDVTTPASDQTGLLATSGTVIVQASTIQGSVVALAAPGGAFAVATSLIQGSIAGTLTCVDDYKADFTPLNSTCT